MPEPNQARRTPRAALVELRAGAPEEGVHGEGDVQLLDVQRLPGLQRRAGAGAALFRLPRPPLGPPRLRVLGVLALTCIALACSARGRLLTVLPLLWLYLRLHGMNAADNSRWHVIAGQRCLADAPCSQVSPSYRPERQSLASIFTCMQHHLHCEQVQGSSCGPVMVPPGPCCAALRESPDSVWNAMVCTQSTRLP